MGTGTEISEKLPLGKIHIETGLPTYIGLPMMLKIQIILIIEGQLGT